MNCTVGLGDFNSTNGCFHFSPCYFDSSSMQNLCSCTTGWYGPDCSLTQFPGGLFPAFLTLRVILGFAWILTGVLAVYFIVKWRQSLGKAPSGRFHPPVLQELGLLAVVMASFFSVNWYAISLWDQDYPRMLAARVWTSLCFNLALWCSVVAYSLIMGQWVNLTARKLKRRGWSPLAKGLVIAMNVVVLLVCLLITVLEFVTDLTVNYIYFPILAVAAFTVGLFCVISGVSVFRQLSKFKSGSKGKIRSMAVQLVLVAGFVLLTVIALGVIAGLTPTLDSDRGLFLAFRLVVPQILEIITFAWVAFYLRRRSRKDHIGTGDTSRASASGTSSATTDGGGL